VSSETQSHAEASSNAEAGDAHETHEGHGGHEDNLLAHRHPTFLNAYPIVLEAAAGRFDPSATVKERFSQAAERVTSETMSPTPGAIVQWVPVTTVGSWCVIAVLLLLLHRGTRRMEAVPGRLQCIWEWVYQTFGNFSRSMIGEEKGSQFTPILATFFIYIFLLNLGGIIPGFLSATAGLNMTVALALCCFCAVQYFGFKHQGLGYLKHFVGEPWWFFPINIPIHVIGELARPLSLSIRLFGNIFGEDAVIANLIVLGVIGLGTGGWMIPIPFQFPMLLFGIFGAFIQALVFTMLSASYIGSVVEVHR